MSFPGLLPARRIGPISTRRCVIFRRLCGALSLARLIHSACLPVARRAGYGRRMILQERLPYDAFGDPRLPGTRPLGDAPWLLVDEAHAAQMAERARLLRDHRSDVLQLSDEGRAAADELLEFVLGALPAGFQRQGAHVRRPDGVRILLDRDDPLGTLGHLVQEDLCLLEHAEGAQEHVMTGAVLCFPASWRLAEKFLRPLTAIHDPVPVYDVNLARRVQRLFHGLQVGHPVWRFNALWYADPTLHQPRSEVDPRPIQAPGAGRYLRSERQCLLRLPQTRAVVFSIHTYVLAGAEADAQTGRQRPTGR